MVKSIPDKTTFKCNHTSVDHNHEGQKVIHPGSCKNEDCQCGKKSPVHNKHRKMKRLELTADLLTGIAEIDKQHSKLFDMGNSVLFPDTAELSTREFAEALIFLARYVNFHFLAEEDGMERYSYDRVESHKKQHHRLREDIKDLIKRAENEGPTKHLKLKFHYMFSDWFTYHIKHTDRLFAEYVKDKNSRGS
jgi:hemerythrin